MVTHCIATQNLNTDRKENWTCENIYKQINFKSKQTFTIYMKVHVPSHNLPHPKYSWNKDFKRGRLLEYNTIIINSYSLFHFVLYSGWYTEN